MFTREYRKTKPIKLGDCIPSHRKLRSHYDIFMAQVQKEDEVLVRELVSETEGGHVYPFHSLPKRRLLGFIAQIFQ